MHINSRRGRQVFLMSAIMQIFFMTIITKEKKIEIVDHLCENIKKQDGVFFVNFKGVKGGDSKALRSELKKSGSEMIVARKTLVKIAFEKGKIDFDPLSLSGETGFVFSFEDAINTAKIIRKFDKEEKITILGGIYESKVLTVEEVKTIADLPTKEELLSKFLGTISAPLSGFLQVLQGNTKGLLYALSSISQKK
jgi:large subunit ribosomal protein L10